MCLYSTSTEPTKIFLQTWTMSKGFIKLTESTHRWMNCLSNCCLSQQNDLRMSVEDLQILSIRMLWGLSCTWRCVCVCLCNHSIKPTAITNGISWVDSRSLSLLIDFLWFPSGQLSASGPRWESQLWAGWGGGRIVADVWSGFEDGNHLSVSGRVK